MDHKSAQRQPDRQPQRWTGAALVRSVLAAVLLVTAVLTAQAGGLLERLFTGKETQRAEASRSQPSTTLATVCLTVEGMICYG